jgi:hypothetical protein
LAPFKHDGEEFMTLSDLVDYLIETQDSDLIKNVNIIKELSKRSMTLSKFIEQVKKHQVQNWRQEATSVDDFDGIVLATCHAVKGLEFDNIFLQDDFNFTTLTNSAVSPSHQLRSSYLLEASDIIYVAVTRAKKSIFLSEAAAKYLDFLNNKKCSSRVPPSKRTKIMLPIELGELRTNLNKEWCLFETRPDKVGSVSEVPFPTVGASFWLDAQMTYTEKQAWVGTMLMRYHPDKFLPSFCERLTDCDHASRRIIEDILRAITVEATELRAVLRESRGRPSDPNSVM